jgi:anti-anti-sigma factor
MLSWLTPPSNRLAEVEIIFDGELDLAVERDISDALYAAAAERRHPPRIVLVMSDVTFMDSTAVRLFLHARSDIRQRGGDLVLRGVSPKQRWLLEVMGLLYLIDE